METSLQTADFFDASNVQVALQIFTALIEKLPRDLPLYAHFVLSAIQDVLRSNDISMVEETILTFETLCNNQDLAVLAADHAYATQYHGVIRTYADFASSSSHLPSRTTLSRPMALRWRKVGLRAIQCVVSSEALGADGGKQLEIVVPVILENLYANGDDVAEFLRAKPQVLGGKPERELPRRRHPSVANVPTVDAIEGNVAEAAGTTADADKVAEMEVRTLALRCLERIFLAGSHRTQLRTAAGFVLQFIVSKHHTDEKEVVDSCDWAKILLDMIVQWCPVQDRFIVLVTAVEILRDMAFEEHLLGQQIILASLIDSVLKSPVNLIGLSVIDVLAVFVQQILRLFQNPQASPKSQSELPGNGTKGEKVERGKREQSDNSNSTAAPNFSSRRTRLSELLKQCTGNLATHIYYADQVSDMVRTIVRRVLSSSTPSDATLDSAARTGAESAASSNNAASERPLETSAHSAAAKVAALEAVKQVLIVANTKRSVAGQGMETRNRVGIQVWDGSHGLLRDSSSQVRWAYADAFIYWLMSETTPTSLRVREPTHARRLSRSQSRKEADEVTKQRISVSQAQVDKASKASANNFISLLHLAIYDNSIDFATTHSEILLMHLLLSSLIQRLGINAIQFGLPMVLKLQEGLSTNQLLDSVTAQINVSSLVYGYLSELSRIFDFESSKVGTVIQGEIRKRKSHGAWLDQLQVPPLPIDAITGVASGPVHAAPQTVCSPFTARDELIYQIENAYAASLLSASSSPTGSPPRTSSSQAFGFVSGVPQELALPADIKEQLCSPWSREACLAMQEESAKASSLGSRNGTSARRSYIQINGIGSGSLHTTGSPSTAQRREQTPSVFEHGSSLSLEGLHNTEGKRSPAASSGDSTIRVNDLKRMLSVSRGNSAAVRRSSPLRSRMDAADSDGTSSTESMMSGTFSVSDIHSESRPQSLRGESVRRMSREGSETPKVSGSAAAGHHQPDEGEGSGYPSTDDASDIPPVPPLPPNLSIPGSFPTGDPASSANVSRQSSLSQRSQSDRPSTAPGPRKSTGSLKPGTEAGGHRRSLAQRKSRSSTNLQQPHLPLPLGLRKTSAPSSSTPSPTTDHRGPAAEARSEAEKLLEGLNNREREDEDAFGALPRQPAAPAIESVRQRRRRVSSGGIGRPPY